MTVVGELPETTSSAAPRVLEPVLDVSHLPSVVYGHRVVTWWGTVMFMVAESATLGACLAAYYYIARNFTAWPPLRTPLPDLLLPTISLVVLLLALIPNNLFAKAAEKVDAPRTRRWMWIAVVLMFAAVVLRLFEFQSLNVRWDANAYASVTWMIVFAHFTLLLVDTLETLVFTVMVQRGRMPVRYFPGIGEDGLYTNFMVLSWIPCFVTVYLVPRWI